MYIMTNDMMLVDHTVSTFHLVVGEEGADSPRQLGRHKRNSVSRGKFSLGFSSNSTNLSLSFVSSFTFDSRSNRASIGYCHSLITVSPHLTHLLSIIWTAAQSPCDETPFWAPSGLLGSRDWPQLKATETEMDLQAPPAEAEAGVAVVVEAEAETEAAMVVAMVVVMVARLALFNPRPSSSLSLLLSSQLLSLLSYPHSFLLSLQLLAKVVPVVLVASVRVLGPILFKTRPERSPFRALPNRMAASLGLPIFSLLPFPLFLTLDLQVAASLLTPS